jgi:SAM-dependent methyltransferase
MMFKAQKNTRPSLKILNALRNYDDFMESIGTLVDLGCGAGEDLVWWATATTSEDSPQPLNIRCVGVDMLEQLPVAHNHPNITYQPTDFEKQIHATSKLFDVLWCHNAFQYCVEPISTLAKWKNIASDGAMLVIAVPQTITVERNQLAYNLPSGVHYHHTMVSLIYMLALAGWDCRSGFFQQLPQDPWIRAVVYKTAQQPRDPKTTTWYDLSEAGLLPESADRSIQAHGYLRQQDLVIPWLDHSLSWLGKV